MPLFKKHFKFRFSVAVLPNCGSYHCFSCHSVKTWDQSICSKMISRNYGSKFYLRFLEFPRLSNSKYRVIFKWIRHCESETNVAEWLGNKAEIYKPFFHKDFGSIPTRIRSLNHYIELHITVITTLIIAMQTKCIDIL